MLGSEVWICWGWRSRAGLEAEAPRRKISEEQAWFDAARPGGVAVIPEVTVTGGHWTEKGS